MNIEYIFAYFIFTYLANLLVVIICSVRIYDTDPWRFTYLMEFVYE